MTQAFGFLTLAIVLYQYIPYCRGILRGELRPHIFSYIVWGIGAAVVGAAQWSVGAGPGAWAMAMTALFCGLVVVLSLRRGTGYVTIGDCLTLAAALSAMPLWIATESPLLAVLVVTAIDLAAYSMTLRKVWSMPQEESALFYAIALAQYALSIAATEVYSLTALLNPVVLIAATTALVGAIRWRRRPHRLTG
jgi:hypothetical protein